MFKSIVFVSFIFCIGIKPSTINNMPCFENILSGLIMIYNNNNNNLREFKDRT